MVSKFISGKSVMDSYLGKEYSAKGILERIGMEGILQGNEQKKDKEFVEKGFKETNYSKGIVFHWQRFMPKG